MAEPSNTARPSNTGRPSIERLEGVVQNYDWGDPTAIPELLGTEPNGTPQAELWLGSHPRGPGRLGDGTSLEAITDLPFLLKVLAARMPLSIQSHPSLDQARAGFAKEDAAGIAIDAPDRVYRDANHKPELICALTPFKALCGFRRPDASRAILAAFDRNGETFAPLAARLAESSLAEVVTWVLASGSPEVAAMAAVFDPAARPFGAHTGDAAVAIGAARHCATHFPGDPGVVLSLLMNHVTLEPGQAVFLEAGNLHAYLEGVGIEVMANSDNVVRGGLTPKHVDVDELLAVVSFEPIDPPVQRRSGTVQVYDSPIPEFELTRYDFASFGVARALEVEGPEIVLVTMGWIEVTSGDGDVLTLDKGQAAIVWPDAGRCRAIGAGTLWRARSQG